MSSEAERNHPKVVRFGTFHRKSDSRTVQRFHCRICKKHFSRATQNVCYRQNKRTHNHLVAKLLCSGVSQRRVALLLNLSRTTVVRKFLFMAAQAELERMEKNRAFPPALEVEFDDQETFEHSKCKPLSVTMAVEAKTRRILDFEVARMPAKGPLASLARKKYGKRPDERRKARKELFGRLQPLVHPCALMKSDQNPHYPNDVKKFFPLAEHKAFKGRRGCIVGQGELKKIGFDPLFTLNHTFAMFRANINRLFRKTWCTTKKPERLAAHIALYVHFHNQVLIPKR